VCDCTTNRDGKDRDILIPQRGHRNHRTRKAGRHTQTYNHPPIHANTQTHRHTVAGEEYLLEMWIMMVSSPQMMYETP
jgi:hypothetical protein